MTVSHQRARAAARRERRTAFLRELAEGRALRRRLTPRRSKLARSRELFRMHTYRV